MVVEVYISFYPILTYMARPKISRHKVKTSITIDPELFKWVQSKIETREFSSTTHAIERGLYLLKKEIEGTK